MSRDIRDCSGPWKGLWIQGDLRGSMHGFRLEFSGDAISGGGHDLNGDFTMEGRTDGQHVLIAKRYWHTDVVYDGRWNGSFVAGISIIGPIQYGEFGEFEMWPEDEEQAFDLSSISAGLEEPVTV